MMANVVSLSNSNSPFFAPTIISAGDAPIPIMRGSLLSVFVRVTAPVVTLRPTRRASLLSATNSSLPFNTMPTGLPVVLHVAVIVRLAILITAILIPLDSYSAYALVPSSLKEMPTGCFGKLVAPSSTAVSGL